MVKQQLKKIRVAVLCGGESAEHEVSIQSARNVVAALDPRRYDVKMIGIDQAGSWHALPINRLLATNGSSIKKIDRSGRELVPYLGVDELDVAFPVLHGPRGEDGTIQGLLTLAKVPYVGSGVMASAVSMDKDIMKRLLLQAGLKTARYLAYRVSESKRISYNQVAAELGAILFVKPANLGSSVGISKVHTAPEFIAAVELAFRYDTKIIVEEYIVGKEIECAVLGNDKPQASICGEIVPQHEFYSYAAKYLDESGAQLLIPASITPGQAKEVQRLAVETFRLLGCAGLARVDFFVGKQGIYVNELNTIPGFTAISMYPKLWAASGIPYAKLISTLIDLALERHKKEQKLATSITLD